jgi:DNA-binding transcriptional LysR family regulator
MLDVRRLKVLREVAARGSFSAAAEALSFTQSAVSQQVAALERECGTKLLERGPRGVRLTDAGRALVSHADAILARLADAEEELAAIAGLRGGRLRIASFQSAGATLVPRALGEFHNRFPDVELVVTQAEMEEARAGLASGELDVAIVMDFEDMPLLAPELELTFLLHDPYDVALPKDHRLAGRAQVDLADLAEDRWVLPQPGVGCQEGIFGACRQFGFEPRERIETDENEQLQAFIAAGLGVALFPRLALTAPRPGVFVAPVTGTPLVRRVFAATLKDAYCSPAAEAMIEILRDAGAEFEPAEASAA